MLVSYVYTNIHKWRLCVNIVYSFFILFLKHFQGECNMCERLTTYPSIDFRDPAGPTTDHIILPILYIYYIYRRYLYIHCTIIRGDRTDFNTLSLCLVCGTRDKNTTVIRK